MDKKDDIVDDVDGVHLVLLNDKENLICRHYLKDKVVVSLACLFLILLVATLTLEGVNLKELLSLVE